MILINNPDKSVWVELLKRPMMNTESLHETVRSILNQIKNEGDEAVLEYLSYPGKNRFLSIYFFFKLKIIKIILIREPSCATFKNKYLILQLGTMKVPVNSGATRKVYRERESYGS